MDLFSNASPFNASLAILFGLVSFAAMLVFEARALAEKPKLIKPTLRAYAASLAFLTLIAGWLAFQLSFAECRPYTTAEVNAVLEKLDAGAQK